jgi:hypothetical protein
MGETNMTHSSDICLLNRHILVDVIFEPFRFPVDLLFIRLAADFLRNLHVQRCIIPATEERFMPATNAKQGQRYTHVPFRRRASCGVVVSPLPSASIDDGPPRKTCSKQIWKRRFKAYPFRLDDRVYTGRARRTNLRTDHTSLQCFG